MLDGLIWYCDKCNTKLHEYRFRLDNIEKDFLPRFRELYGSKEMRTCKKCDTVMEPESRFDSCMRHCATHSQQAPPYTCPCAPFLVLGVKLIYNERSCLLHFSRRGTAHRIRRGQNCHL